MNEYAKFGRENVTATNKVTTEMATRVGSALWHSTNIDENTADFWNGVVLNETDTLTYLCAHRVQPNDRWRRRIGVDVARQRDVIVLDHHQRVVLTEVD